MSIEGKEPKKKSVHIGNQWWLARSSHGRDPIFACPDDLWDASCEYFKWVEDHPLFEDKPMVSGGEVVHESIAKMRAMTQAGLCLYLDVTENTYRNYSKKEDFFKVTSAINDIIRSQKFAGAAAGLLNANIIARDLGLKDGTDSTITTPDGKPFEVDQKFTVEFINAPGES